MNQQPEKKFAKQKYRLNTKRNKYILVDDKKMTIQHNVTEPTTYKNDDNIMTNVSNELNTDDNINTHLIYSKEIITDKSLLDKNGIKVIVDSSQNINDDINNTLVINATLKENIIKLAENYNELNELLEWFRNKDDKSNTNITIDLPGDDYIRTTVRLDKKVWDEFNNFCNENNHLNKQDLQSMALKEYIKNHRNND